MSSEMLSSEPARQGAGTIWELPGCDLCGLLQLLVSAYLLAFRLCLLDAMSLVALTETLNTCSGITCCDVLKM
jgi:hypothetical protein